MANFSVRARAVDMLGRQQIAGIPTAFHELFKNAHDAYARRVEVDYFRADRELMLRDNGDGMSLVDFEGKWLTLGTESKVDANRKDDAAQKEGPRGLKLRKILGEKGIGRLAIAAIGPVVLVMTRCDPDVVKEDKLTVALVHWGLFETPGVELSAIDIPIISLPGGTLPGAEEVKSLIDSVEACIDLLLPRQLRQGMALKVEDAERLKRREASTRERKRKFSSDLNRVLDLIERGEPAEKAHGLKGELFERLSNLDSADDEDAASRLLEIEREFVSRLEAIEGQSTLTRPRGLAPSPPVEAAWKAYEQAAGNIRATVFEPVRAAITHAISDYKVERGLGVERQKRAMDALEREKSESLSEVRRLRREAEQALTLVQAALRVPARMRDFTRSARGAKRVTVRDVLGDLRPLSSGERDPADALHVSRTHHEITLKRLAVIPQNGGGRDSLPPSYSWHAIRTAMLVIFAMSTVGCAGTMSLRH